jgi:hypothetical protein
MRGTAVASKDKSAAAEIKLDSGETTMQERIFCEAKCGNCISVQIIIGILNETSKIF